MIGFDRVCEITRKDNFYNTDTDNNVDTELENFRLNSVLHTISSSHFYLFGRLLLFSFHLIHSIRNETCLEIVRLDRNLRNRYN